jgi:geranylgeranyl diphosphate synthase type I
MTIALPATLERSRELIEPWLREAVDRLDGSSRQVAAYHHGWIEADGRPTDGGGKAVRPALALLSAEAVGASAQVGIPGAVAVELVHNFSLLHDDVMDRDQERRHRPTAWTVFGSSAAILAGDALQVLAFEALLDAPPLASQRALRSLARATQQLILGQVDDLDFEGRADVGLAECLEMAGGKTAALLACAASIGAQLTGASEEVITSLETYGYELGLAFQLIDDLLGIWGSTANTGKPVGSDLRAQKKSLPVVAAMTSGTIAGDRLCALYTSGDLNQASDDSVIAQATAFVQDAGGRAWAIDEADRRLKLACGALDAADLQEQAREELREIATYVTARDH